MKSSSRKIAVLLVFGMILSSVVYAQNELIIGGNIFKLVILSTAAVLSAVIGAGASGIEEGYRGRSVYRILLKKDFGDKLYPGNNVSHIYARIVEITPEKIERRRLDLTRQIEIYSDESFIEVGPTLIAGTYAEASIKVLEGYDNLRTGTIAVVYRGSKGIYKNNIEFKIDKPRKRS